METERGRDRGPKEQDGHICTYESTEDGGKGELKRTNISLFVPQIFIEAKTDPERWERQTGEALYVFDLGQGNLLLTKIVQNCFLFFSF